MAIFQILTLNPKILSLGRPANGQTKSKRFFQADVSSKNRRNKFDFTTMIPQVDLFSFVFWKKLKTPKRHFEINWPLPSDIIPPLVEIFKGKVRRSRNRKNNRGNSDSSDFHIYVFDFDLEHHSNLTNWTWKNALGGK